MDPNRPDLDYGSKVERNLLGNYSLVKEKPPVSTPVNVPVRVLPLTVASKEYVCERLHAGTGVLILPLAEYPDMSAVMDPVDDAYSAKSQLGTQRIWRPSTDTVPEILLSLTVIVADMLPPPSY